MGFIAPALGDERHLGTGRPTEIRIRCRCHHPELLNRIQRIPEDARKWHAAILVVHVNAIQRDVRLVALRSVYRTVSDVAHVLGVLRIRTDECDSRLQREQPCWIACVEWQLADRLRAERVADRSVSGVQLRGVSGDCDGFHNRPHFQLDRKRSVRVDTNLQALDHDIRKPLLGSEDEVSSGPQLSETVVALRVRGCTSLRAVLYVGGDD